MAMPLSEELWRPTSCSCRGRSGFGVGLAAPGAASPGAWAAASPGPSCDVLAEDEDGSGHGVSRLLALTSEWLASDDELDTLRSSPGWERPGLRLQRGSATQVGGGRGEPGWGADAWPPRPPPCASHSPSPDPAPRVRPPGRPPPHVNALWTVALGTRREPLLQGDGSPGHT